MNIFETLYLKLSKKRFLKTFKPLGIKKKRNFLISAPSEVSDFLKALPFIEGLKKLGNIVMLMPKKLKDICCYMKPNVFEMIFYEEPSKLFSKEYKRLKKKLGNTGFHFLIDLNKPANISLPYLVSAEKRICFYEKNNYPYYNIMIKQNINSLVQFFDIESSNPQNLFHFYVRDLKKTLKKFKKKKPLLFINGENNITWEGDKIIVGKDILSSDPEVYKILYFSDAYYGQCDALYEFMKIFNKRIVES
jgi:hypothetical protein